MKENPPMTSNEVLLAKAKRQLQNSMLILESAPEIDAKACEDSATLALTAARLLLRLAGRIDVPRPDPVKVVKPKKKPKVVTEVPRTKEEQRKSARRGGGIVNVSGMEYETEKAKVKKSGSKTKRPASR
jgi:hypothetical protein